MTSGLVKGTNESTRASGASGCAEGEEGGEEAADHRHLHRRGDLLHLLLTADERPRTGVEPGIKEKAEDEEAEEGDHRGDRKPVRSSAVAPLRVPRSAWAIRPCEARAIAPGIVMQRYCVSAAAPMPRILPAISWVGVAALIMISMIRLLFSSTTPPAIHMP